MSVLERDSSAYRMDWVELKKSDIETKKPLIIPRYQSSSHDGRRTIRQITSSVSVPSSALNTTTQFQYVIDVGSAGSVFDCTFRFNIGIAGSATRLNPSTHWWNYITVVYRKTNEEIQRFYPDDLQFRAGMLNMSSQRKFADQVGMNSKSHWVDTDIAVGQSKYVYLTLPTFWVDFAFDMTTDISKQLEFRFFPAGDIRYSGGGTVTLNECLLFMQSDEGPSMEVDRKAHLSIMSKYVPMHNFLNPVQTFYTNTSNWAASTNINVDLQSFKHLSAGLIFFIVSDMKTTAAGVNRRYINFDGSGSGEGLIGLLDVGNKSQLGGTATNATYYRKYLASQWFNVDYINNNYVYPIIFTEDIRKAQAGMAKDYFPFDGSQYKLSLTSPAAGTNETQTITVSAVPASGTYKLGWADPVTGIVSYTASLAAATTTGNMATAFNALESVIQSKLTASFSATVGSGGPVVVTFTDTNGFPVILGGNLILVDSDLADAGPANINLSVARTTIGVPGWVTGTYTVVIYSYSFRCVRKRMGDISSNDLL